MPSNPAFHPVVTKQLVQRFEGNFLWVYLALKGLLDVHSKEDIVRILEDMPSGMKFMYQRMANSIISSPEP